LLRKYHERGIVIFSCKGPRGDEKSTLYAALLGRDNVFRLLHELGDDLNAVVVLGHTPVYAAAQEGHVRPIRTLCELGADVNTPNKSGQTPVYAAAAGGHDEAIRMLCELGADINAADKITGIIPVCVAAHFGHEKVVKLLHKLGADMNEESKLDCSPAAAARVMGHDAVTERLVRYTSQCACCQTKASVTVKLLACSRCKKTFYCSAACQKQDWKKHKLGCSTN
jgi:uncharacterized protein